VIVAAAGALSEADRRSSSCRKVSIPVVTPRWKDMIPDTHPLAWGSSAPTPVCANRSSSDSSSTAGAARGQVTNDWTSADARPVIQIDIDPAELGRSYPNASLLETPKSPPRMIGLSQENAENRNERAAKQLVSDWRKEMEALCVGAAPIRTESCAGDRDAFPADGILGRYRFASIWTGGMVNFSSRGETSSGRQGPRLGLPARLAAKCGAPKRPVSASSVTAGLLPPDELETPAAAESTS